MGGIGTLRNNINNTIKNGPFSGQKTVATAGTAVNLATGNESYDWVDGPLMIKALPGNTGYVYVGRDVTKADVASTNGLVLDKGDVIVFNYVGSLAAIWIDSAVNGEGVSWIALNVA